jgi:glycosyltransferase involved in cell wall biosynthesis
MKQLNHTVIKIPMYLPLFSDEHDLAEVPVFYGAVNLYLKQMSSLFRKSPKWFQRMLDSKAMLKLASGMSGSTDPTGLENMTISMLLGEDGKQREELDKLADWIAEHADADIIHLSNALLLGLAAKLKERTGAKVICSLQDEDVWVDAMNEQHRKEVWDLMAAKAKDVDRFVAVSDFYAKVSIDRMGLNPDTISTIHLGVDPDDYQFKPAEKKPRHIGYISRTNFENGFDIIVDAFIQLKQKPDMNDVKLIVTGGSTGTDKKFLKSVWKKLKLNNLVEQVEFMESFEGQARQDFFDKVSMISVPVRNGEAFGIYLTEAMASGVPVVQPNLGAFPEIVAKSKGGLIYQKNTPEDLAAGLSRLIENKEELKQLSTNARTSIEKDFDINELAKELVKVYESVNV